MSPKCTISRPRNPSPIRRRSGRGNRAPPQQAVQQPAQAAAPPPPEPDLPPLSESQAHVWALVEDQRPRLAGIIYTATSAHGVIEFRSRVGELLDRMTFNEIVSFGVAVSAMRHGVRLTVPGRSALVTPWPLQEASGGLVPLSGLVSAPGLERSPRVSEPNAEARPASVATRTAPGQPRIGTNYTPPSDTRNQSERRAGYHDFN